MASPLSKQGQSNVDTSNVVPPNKHPKYYHIDQTAEEQYDF
jgi:hypothetical protein